MWEKRILFIAVGFFLMIPAFLSAQTAAELETLLESPAVSYAQAAQFVLASTGNDASGEGDASGSFRQAMDMRWFREGTRPDESITLGKLSFLVMKAFNLKGGMMYAMFPGPRYAFRSMVSRSFIQGASDPAMKVSGERFLQILGKVLSETEEDL